MSDTYGPIDPQQRLHAELCAAQQRLVDVLEQQRREMEARSDADVARQEAQRLETIARDRADMDINRRDHFAALAMQALLEGFRDDAKGLASCAYEIADAMMSERSKRV
jgi:hypothetical protein